MTIEKCFPMNYSIMNVPSKVTPSILRGGGEGLVSLVGINWRFGRVARRRDWKKGKSRDKKNFSISCNIKRTP